MMTSRVAFSAMMSFIFFLLPFDLLVGGLEVDMFVVL